MDMRLKFLSDTMRAIDFGMLTTRTEGGAFASRPMSNNGEVDYDGNSYFFTFEQARSVTDIGQHAQVGLTFTGSPDERGQPPLFIAIQGTAELIRDRELFAAHWTADLERWFQQGIDTPGMVMIRVVASRIHYWDGAKQGDITLEQPRLEAVR
jgi:general stress protein 26